MRIYHSNFKDKCHIHEDLNQGIHLYILTEEIARYCQVLKGNYNSNCSPSRSNIVRKMRFFSTKNGIISEHSSTALRRLW